MIKSQSQSIFDNDTISGGDIVYKILGIDETKIDKSPKVIIDHKSRKALIDDSRICESASESNLCDIEHLKHLLQQEDARRHHGTTTYRTVFDIKKVKNASKELLNKRLSAFKAMRTHSSSQDSSDPHAFESKNDFTLYTPNSSVRSSMTDLGGAKAKVKRVKRTKPKLGPTTNEGIGMTTLLVRSLMVTPSLDCISENVDVNRKNSLVKPLMPGNRTDSLTSLPTIATTPGLHAHRKRNKLQLSLGDSLIDLKACDSNVSSNAVTSCEESSLSEEEDDEEEEEEGEYGNDDLESLNENNEVVLIDADTINMVVKSALAMDEGQTGESVWIRPSDLDTESDDGNKKEETAFKHIDFKSIKTGATRIISSRDNKKKKDVKTCLIESEVQSEIIEHMIYDLPDQEEQTWIQPGSTASDDGDDNEPRQNSMLTNFKESISEKIHHMHLPHPHLTQVNKNEIKDHSLLGTAMENMLIEQAEMLGAHALSPNAEQAKLESKRNSSFDSLRKLLTSPFRRISNDSIESLNKKAKNSISSPSSPLHKKKFGLVDTAMKTMVTETAHIIEGIGINPIDETKLQQNDNNTGDLENKYLLSSSLSLSYNKFCDNFRGSQILDNFSTENKSNLPMLLLTEPGVRSNQDKLLLNQSLRSLNSLPPNQNHVPNTRSHTQSLQSIPCELRKSSNHSNHHNNNLTKNQIATTINPTNITKTLAPRSCPISRSGDTISINNANNKILLTSMANGNNQINANNLRSDPNTERITTSPNKVTNSTSYGNTTLAAANATTPIDANDKDKDKENNICRRSSDSDLSITPKGKY